MLLFGIIFFLNSHFFLEYLKISIFQSARFYNFARRCLRGRTPAELARTRNHTDTMNLIEGWTKILASGRPRQLSQRQFLHGTIDRIEATNLCLQGGPGAFLVRESRRRPGDLVLTVNFNNHVFNYEVRNGDHLWFSIDDGPMFESIELLIDYYLHAADGLPGTLTRPIEPIDEATKAQF